MMYKELKVVHDDAYVIYRMDIDTMTVEAIEDESDELLRVIFSHRDYQGIVNWMSSRFGGEKDVNTIFEIIKRNNGKSVKDHILLYVEDK